MASIRSVLLSMTITAAVPRPDCTSCTHSGQRVCVWGGGLRDGMPRPVDRSWLHTRAEGSGGNTRWVLGF